MAVSIVQQVNNIHAVKLMRDNTGTVISPYSISSAMYLLALGLRGTSLDELAKAYDIDPSYFEASIQDTISTQNLLNSSTDSKILIVNSFYVQNKFPLISSYTNQVNQIGSIESVDFSDSENVQNKINLNVSNNTENLITKLIPDGVLDEDTKLVITNTLYFKGTWSDPFIKAATKKAPFATIDGETIEVDLMEQKAKYYSYYEDTNCQAVMIPYTGGCRMLVILPRIDSDKMASAITVIENCQQARVKVFLPKFTQRSKTSLINVYKEMGVNDIFDSCNANLSGMTSVKGLYVSDIFHEAVIIVDETSTEAAASTAVVFKLESCLVESDPKIVRADHTFQYHILSPNDLILFSGVYNG
jgi:serpin B